MPSKQTLLIYSVLAAAFIGVIGLFLLLLSRSSSSFEAPNSCPPSKISWIEGVAGFTLPPSASNLQSYCFQVDGWYADAKFDMSPDDLDIFLASTYLETPPTTGGTPELLPRKFKEEIEALDTYLYGRYDSQELTQQIIIDTSDPELYRVYIYLFSV